MTRHEREIAGVAHDAFSDADDKLAVNFAALDRYLKRAPTQHEKHVFALVWAREMVSFLEP